MVGGAPGGRGACRRGGSRSRWKRQENKPGCFSGSDGHIRHLFADSVRRGGPQQQEEEEEGGSLRSSAAICLWEGAGAAPLNGASSASFAQLRGRIMM